MAIQRPKMSKDDGKPFQIIFNNFKGGTLTLADETRVPNTAVVTSTNHILDEDGVWMPRPGSAPYGQPLSPTSRGTVASTVTNFCTNPSMEVDTTSWAGNNATVARTTSTYLYGTASLAATVSSSSGNPYVTFNYSGLTVGKNYNVSVYVNAPAGTPLYLNVYGLNNVSSPTVTATGTWQQLTVTGQCTLASNQVLINVNTPQTVGTVIYIDGLLITDDTTSFAYFDGSTTSTSNTQYAWTGTAGSSTSTKTVYNMVSTNLDGIGTATVYSGTTRTTYLFATYSGNLAYSVDGKSWTVISGTAFTSGYKMQLMQVKNRLYIANGKDNLSYVDLTNMTLVTYTALTTPAAPTLSLQTLTTGSYNQYYKITAVSTVGETAASAEATITTNKQRANWNTNGTESVTLTWSAVTNATRYNIYYSDQTGQEVFLDSVTGTSYIDNGRAVANPYQAAPPFDGTAGPAVGRLALSGNRIWATKDYNNLYRVWFTGVGKDLGSFNPYVGGGYIDLNLGSEELPIDVQHFRDGKGNQQCVVLTTSPTGGGSVWFVTLATLTVDVVNVVIPNAVSQGSIGSSSPYGNVQAQNSIFYPSIKGFQTLGSSASIFNVIVTTETSANIRPNVRAIKSSAANQICGIYYFGKIYYSVPYSSDVNNQIWILDLERQSWAIAWNIGVKQFVEYTDSAGVTHLLGLPVTGSQIIEFSNSFSGDSGVAFPVDLESGLIHFDDNHFTWAWVQKAYIELGRPNGNLSFSVSGTGANKTLSSIKSMQITSTVTTTGLGNDLWGDFLFGSTNQTPKSYAQSSVKKVILVNKKLNNIKWSLSSSDINAKYKVLEVGIIGTLRPSADPGSWRK